MCDEFTAEVDEATLAKRGLNRREFAALSAAAMGTMTISAACSAQDAGAGLVEAAVAVTTKDGKMDGFFVHPAEGKHPAIVMWPDIAGLRDAYKMMARSLAQKGYAVLVVNQYYRSAVAPVMNSISEFFAPEGRDKITPMMQKITNPGIASDAKALLAWLDTQDPVDATKKIGVEGYCMTGGYATRCAAAVPDRVGAACSFHGAGLVTPAPDSVHRLLKGTKALYLFAIAQNDDKRSPTDKVELRKAAEEAGVGARIEVFHGDHGWCTLDAPVYNKEEAERARGLSLWLYDKMG